MMEKMDGIVHNQTDTDAADKDGSQVKRDSKPAHKPYHHDNRKQIGDHAQQAHFKFTEHEDHKKRNQDQGNGITSCHGFHDVI